MTTFGVLRSAQAIADWTMRIGKSPSTVTKVYHKPHLFLKSQTKFEINHFVFSKLNAQNKQAKLV